MLNSFKVIKFNSISLLLVTIIGISNAVALVYLKHFMTNIGVSKNNKFIDFLRYYKYYSISVSLIFTAVGITIAYYMNDILGGLIAGLGMATVILLLLPKKIYKIIKSLGAEVKISGPFSVTNTSSSILIPPLPGR